MANPNGNPSSLRPWKKGQTGNPRGSSNKQWLTGLIRKALDESILLGRINPDYKTSAEMLTESMIYHAITGSAPHMREIMDRIDGKVTDKLDVTSDGKALGAETVLHFEDNGFGNVPATDEETHPSPGGAAT